MILDEIIGIYGLKTTLNKNSLCCLHISASLRALLQSKTLLHFQSEKRSSCPQLLTITTYPIIHSTTIVNRIQKVERSKRSDKHLETWQSSNTTETYNCHITATNSKTPQSIETPISNIFTFAPHQTLRRHRRQAWSLPNPSTHLTRVVPVESSMTH